MFATVCMRMFKAMNTQPHLLLLTADEPVRVATGPGRVPLVVRVQPTRGVEHMSQRDLAVRKGQLSLTK